MHTPPASTSSCPLCLPCSEHVIWQGNWWRLISAHEEGFPAFYRLISQVHAAEWSDLPLPQRQQGIELLTALETLTRQHLHPTKMNLATLGNVVAHVHWHIIARFDWDSHFPNPIWGTAIRALDAERLHEIQKKLPALEAAMVAYLEQNATLV